LEEIAEPIVVHYMPKERNKANDYREKAYLGDTKAMSWLSGNKGCAPRSLVAGNPAKVMKQI